jgi:NAD(P)-dependent dehydrogenase (short-subunit alcohol dehydrogenase family)
MKFQEEKQRIALVAGAAGGLGKETVRALLANHFHVIAVDIDIEKLSVESDKVTTLQADISDYNQLMNKLEVCRLNESGLDVLICMAGIYRSFPLTEEQPELFGHIMQVNLMGTANLIQILLNPLIRNKGRVIVVSSESYKIQALFQPYMVSKAALEAYCLAARQELTLKALSLSVIRPGAIGTPLLNWMKNEPEAGKYPVFDEEYRNSFRQSVRMVGKISSPASVAAIIVKASVASRPKRVYMVNNNLFLTLVALLPKRLIEWMVKRKFRKIDS